MKKLILLLSIITICYSCQKQTVEPTLQNNIQQSTCGPLGDCFSGTYVFDSVLTVNTPNAIDTICTGLTFILSYNGDTIINNLDFIKYKTDSLFNTTPYISYQSIVTLNTLRWQKYWQAGNTFGLQTKTNKMLVFKKI